MDGLVARRPTKVCVTFGNARWLRIGLEGTDQHERAPVRISNMPDRGIAAQFTSESAIMIIAASCICIASIEL